MNPFSGDGPRPNGTPHHAASTSQMVAPAWASIDRYLRREDTPLAHLLTHLSSARGSAYSTSGAKRALDLLIAIPAALLSLPVVGMLLALNKALHPDEPALFVQDRVDHDSEALRVAKIRSMTRHDGDSRITRQTTAFGRFMRRHYLDELPQILQVITGKLSLVGIRILPLSVYRHLGDVWSPARYARWQSVYGGAPLGLTGLQQVLRRRGKEDEQRFHRDVFYATRASLGFDLYLIWRTVTRIGKSAH